MSSKAQIAENFELFFSCFSSVLLKLVYLIDVVIALGVFSLKIQNISWFLIDATRISLLNEHARIKNFWSFSSLLTLFYYINTSRKDTAI